METRSIDNLVQDEGALSQVRGLFFPIIRERVITGYNLFTNVHREFGGAFVFDYYHSELGREDAHYLALEAVLEREGFLQPLQYVAVRRVSWEVLGRLATYRSSPSWLKDNGMRVFTLDGVELSIRDAIKFEDECIVEQEQYKLSFDLQDETNLRTIANIFKKYTSVFKLDGKGRRLLISSAPDQFRENTDSNGARLYIEGAWEVPLLSFTAKKKPSGFRDFLSTSLFSITFPTSQAFHAVAEILVRSQTARLAAILDSTKLDFEKIKVYALRTFVEDYLET